MRLFDTVNHKDEQKYGEYRTKHVILEIYDTMAEVVCTGKPYQTLLNPPPAMWRICYIKSKCSVSMPEL